MRHVVTIAALALTLTVSACATGAKQQEFSRSDIDAIKTLVSLPTKDEKQLGQWLDAYFRDVS